MSDLRSLLGKYSNLGISQKRKKAALVQVLFEMFDVRIAPSQVSLTKDEAQLQIPSALRFVVHQNKKQILAALATALGSDKEITEIR
jgi:hypothetical protein